MNRKMNATDLKLNALLRSRMMEALEFRNLVTKVNRFFYDHKLYELMKKKCSRNLSTDDHKFDFYSILLELLYEVHRNDSSEQTRLFEKVLEWYKVNEGKLEFVKNIAPQSTSVAQLSKYRNTTQVNQQKRKEFPKLPQQHSPTDCQPKENFQLLTERPFHTQVLSERENTKNPFSKREVTLNLKDVINASDATSAPINPSTRKRVQSLPIHQVRTVSKATEINPQQTGIPRSAQALLSMIQRGSNSDGSN
ncbi:uncharacterized protein [Narcine bancroftii]|uniref:uncharacterized protein n=1 Tax=Narcine bancroftii TaxID=1343680 RepID=UPI00383125DA